MRNISFRSRGKLWNERTAAHRAAALRVVGATGRTNALEGSPIWRGSWGPRSRASLATFSGHSHTNTHAWMCELYNVVLFQAPHLPARQTTLSSAHSFTAQLFIFPFRTKPFSFLLFTIFGVALATLGEYCKRWGCVSVLNIVVPPCMCVCVRYGKRRRMNCLLLPFEFWRIYVPGRCISHYCVALLLLWQRRCADLKRR